MGSTKAATTGKLSDEKEIEIIEAPAKIVPTIEKSATPIEVAPAFELTPGYYHLVRLDAAGKEIPGSDFQIGAYNAEKSFVPYPEKYKVKKSPTK